MKKEHEIKRELKRLRSIKGSGTELISLYIPPNTMISDVTNRLKDERGQASNIKSKTTRTNVQSAIDKIVQYLKIFKKLPENGLAVFCGNISSEQAKPDIELFSIEPPAEIKTNIYRCDSSFLLEPLEAMMEIKDRYVLVVMDGRDATVGTLNGAQFNVEKKLRSLAHSKIRKGGQSANRYDRLIEEAIDDYYKRVADAVNEIYAKYNYKIKGAIIGGPGPAKENFVKANYFNYQVKVLGVFDTGYTDEVMGINELIEKSKELLEEQEVIIERKLMERFLSEIARNGLAVYGYENTKKALEKNAVDKLLVSEDLELDEVKYKCNACGAEFTVLEKNGSRQTKHSCGGSLEILSQNDAIEELVEKADDLGVETIFIDEDSQYGKELVMGFGGIAALLRYKI
ncbi:MAG: peptide chain release factor aRF-1 [Candidatus Micrarchaeia archaeon]